MDKVKTHPERLQPWLLCRSWGTINQPEGVTDLAHTLPNSSLLLCSMDFYGESGEVNIECSWKGQGLPWEQRNRADGRQGTLPLPGSCPHPHCPTAALGTWGWSFMSSLWNDNKELCLTGVSPEQPPPNSWALGLLQGSQVCATEAG